MSPDAAKPRVAGATGVARTSRGHAHGNSASPGVGRPPGSDSLASWSQGTFLLGLELPSGESASSVNPSPSSPCGAPVRVTAVWITRLTTLCDARAARVKGLSRNPYVLHRNFAVIPSSGVLVPRQAPLHPQARTSSVACGVSNAACR
jgi:hypothetical protein